MKETVVLTRVYRGKKQTKYGEKDSIGIKTNKHGEKWLSSFKTEGTEKWAENDTVDIYVAEKNGYLNFTLKPAEGAISAELEARIKRLEDKVFGVEVVPKEDDF